MITVQEAEQIILAQARDHGAELVPFGEAVGRVLAEDICADRDLPPCNRVTMDGVAISYAAFGTGTRSFAIKAVIAAGNVPTEIERPGECVEIMTGAALPDSTDTVIRYEDVRIEGGTATVITENIKKGQNIHYKGKDKEQGAILATAGQLISPAFVGIAASVGKSILLVKKLPRVVVISTGDELVDVSEDPSPYQVRRSNSYTVKAVLQQYAIRADMLHLPDEPLKTRLEIEKCLSQYDVIILSGGISMGKFDHVPQVLEELKVTKLFHKVKQRPGKPFWFGTHGNGTVVFAFPGNPVSTFMCLHRYFLPWLETSLKQDPNPKSQMPVYAVLDQDITFSPDLQYFAQVKLCFCEDGRLRATPIEGNGSGDFSNLMDTDAFMELPLEKSIFRKEEVYRVWPFKQIF